RSAPAAAARLRSCRATRRLAARSSRELSWQTATRMRTGYGRGVSRSYLPTLARAEPTPLGRLLLPLPAMPVDEFPRHDRRVDVFEDDLTGDQHAAGVGVARHLVHHRQQ